MKPPLETEKPFSVLLTAIGGATGLVLYFMIGPLVPPEQRHLEVSVAAAYAALGGGTFNLVLLLMPTAASRRRRLLKAKEEEAKNLAEKCDNCLESLRVLETMLLGDENAAAPGYVRIDLAKYDYKLKNVRFNLDLIDMTEDAEIGAREKEAERASRDSRELLHAIKIRVELLRVSNAQTMMRIPIDSIMPPLSLEGQTSLEGQKISIISPNTK